MNAVMRPAGIPSGTRLASPLQARGTQGPGQMTQHSGPALARADIGVKPLEPPGPVKDARHGVVHPRAELGHDEVHAMCDAAAVSG